ncbi:MAG: copper-binding protein [Alphaproteobacteria bacterium]|nr:copper-binding protein [Alphaproteobacteria bacterium]
MLLALSTAIVVHVPTADAMPQPAVVKPESIQLAQADTVGKSEGLVRRIDKGAKKVTLQHGPIEGFDMPAMTMVFQVADPAMLDKIEVGDKVRFTVTRGGGAMTLQSVETAN